MQLFDLPSRRVEAWKYTDLSRALSGARQFTLTHDRASEVVQAGLARGGVIGALAAQMGAVERVCVHAGAEVVRVDRLDGSTGSLTPTFLDVDIEPGGRLTRVVVQGDAGEGVVLDGARVRIGAGGAFRQFVLAEGGKLARVENHVEARAGAQVALNGIYLCGEGRHADLTSSITHQSTGGQTRQLVKGAARKGGRGVFQGKIVVEQGAQQTDARQYHHGMLLEDGAEVFAKPELMIHADDVACAHGNTTGGLDETGLFYLRSRGVPELEARALLIEAFLIEAVPDWLGADLREEVAGRIGGWLRGGR